MENEKLTFYTETGNTFLIYLTWTVMHKNIILKNWYSSQVSIKFYSDSFFFLGTERFVKRQFWNDEAFVSVWRHLAELPLLGTYQTVARESSHLNILQILLFQPLQSPQSPVSASVLVSAGTYLLFRICLAVLEYRCVVPSSPLHELCLRES